MGGALAALAISLSAKSEPVPIRAAIFRMLGKVYGQVVAIGALLTLITGIGLTMSLARSGVGMGRPGVIVMQGAGLIAGILVLAVVVPTANRIATLARRLSDGQLPPGIPELRRRQLTVSLIALALGLVSLLSATLWR